MLRTFTQAAITVPRSSPYFRLESSRISLYVRLCKRMLSRTRFGEFGGSGSSTGTFSMGMGSPVAAPKAPTRDPLAGGAFFIARGVLAGTVYLVLTKLAPAPPLLL